MAEITGNTVPDGFAIVVNAAQPHDEIEKDLEEQFNRINRCYQNSVLYRYEAFQQKEKMLGEDDDKKILSKEMVLTTIPIVMVGIIPKDHVGIKQEDYVDTLRRNFVTIAKAVRNRKLGSYQKDGVFDNILNKVIVTEVKEKYVTNCIGIDMESNYVI